MAEKFLLTAKVAEEMAGRRLDQAAVQAFPDYSRSRLQAWIKSGNLRVDDRPAKTRDKLLGGEKLTLEAEVESTHDWQAEAIPLDLIHEDDVIIVVNKPVGLVVHPAAGNRSGTLLNALLYHCPGLEDIPRAGIVHRLDKDTSGLMVVAKTLSAHQNLVRQLQQRSVTREYQAVVYGRITAGGSVEAPLGRHRVHRTRRAVTRGSDAKAAVTHYRILTRYRSHTLLQLKLETGRTHQIRVHMAHIGHPLVGDQVYGGRLKLPRGAGPELIECLRSFKRQALHAFRLGLRHPVSGQDMVWESPLPEDMRELLRCLEQDNA